MSLKIFTSSLQNKALSFLEQFLLTLRSMQLKELSWSSRTLKGNLTLCFSQSVCKFTTRDWFYSIQSTWRRNSRKRFLSKIIHHHVQSSFYPSVHYEMISIHASWNIQVQMRDGCEGVNRVIVVVLWLCLGVSIVSSVLWLM